MSVKIHFSWTCPHCGLLHDWCWNSGDLEIAQHTGTRMICETCQAATTMIYQAATKTFVAK